MGDNEGGSMGINQNPTGSGDAYLRYSSPVQVGSLTNWAFTTGEVTQVFWRLTPPGNFMRGGQMVVVS